MFRNLGLRRLGVQSFINLILATLADLRNEKKSRQNHKMFFNAKLITSSCKYIFVWCSMMAIMAGHSDGCMLTTTAKTGSARQQITTPYLGRPTDLQTQVLTRDVKPNTKCSAEGLGNRTQAYDSAQVPAGLPWGLGPPLGINLGSLGQPSGGPVHTMGASRLHFCMQNKRLGSKRARSSKNVETLISAFFDCLAKVVSSPLFCMPNWSRLASIV